MIKVAVETAAILLERERELSELADALTEAKRERGQVVLLEAPAGLGKTSLLAAACEMATEAGFTCLRARASELERDFAYGCVRQLLEPAVARVSDPERGRLFEGAAALSTALIAPTDASLSVPSGDSTFSMLHGLYWLLNNISDEGPVALAVDDLHWSDIESLRFLAYLAPRLDGLPVAVLASTRPGEGDTADLARLAATPETTVLRPGPLSNVGAAAMCERSLGSGVAPEFTAACREATGGNPFFLGALLQEVGEQKLSPDSRKAIRVRGIGPDAVAQSVLLRLSAEPAAARPLVRAVAVLGDGASLAEAARLAELSEEDAARAADRLAALAILKPAKNLEFAHVIVREAVHGDIGSHERAAMHARAALILAACRAPEERIAAQITEAEPAEDPERVALLRRVAADALVRGAPAAAAAWLGRALAEPPPPAFRAEVLLELGSAELRLATPGAVDHLTEAVDLIREPGLLARSVRQLANALTMSGDANRAVEALESAIEVVEPADRELALLLEAELAAHAQEASREARAPAARRLERHGELVGATQGERLVLASLAFQRARATESASEATRYVERALADGRLLGEQELDVAGTFFLLMIGLCATDALDLAEACLGQVLSEAHARASIPALAFGLAHRGHASLRRGAVARAEADARTALDLLAAHEVRLGATLAVGIRIEAAIEGRPVYAVGPGGQLALGVLIEALIERGEVETAEKALTSGGFGEEIPPGLPSNPVLEARSLLRLAQGRTREGLDDLIEFGRRDRLWGGANPLASRWRSHASLALAALGDADEARQLAADDLERARRWGSASGVGVALRAVALVGSGAASIDLLREAAEVLARSPARLEHARALTDRGAALRRANRRMEARGALEAGLDLARHCGARPLAERARIELRAAGGRSRQPEGTGVEQLTASERRVAELATQGHSNPEIAQTLFVTRKTVETHLGHVYGKLGISGRGELGRALGDQRRGADG